MWGSNGDGILNLHPIEPHREGYGGDVLFWGFAEANDLDYGTKVLNGSVNLSVYVNLAQTSLFDKHIGILWHKS
jgi:hypothetical protein